MSPADAGFSSAGLERLDRFFAREIEAKRVPGAVVGIVRDGKLVHHKAYGVLDPVKGTPMPLDAIFALASMTKPMAAVAALQLTEDGRLPLKSTLASYYPAFAGMKVGVPQADGTLRLDAQTKPIFIHDLFRHTSGLTYGGRGDHPIAKFYPTGTQPALDGSTADFIERITKLPLAWQPGTVFEYGFSIDVLGAVVEKVAGQRILGPKTVAHMTVNHLGPEIRSNVGVVEPHREGFGSGLGVAVRTQPGLSAVPGNPGEYSWNGANGTQYSADPKERLLVVVGTAAPGDLRTYYREQVQALVYGAMTR